MSINKNSGVRASENYLPKAMKTMAKIIKIIESMLLQL
jgi:hypothetical protein